jgi:pimeloyl-ACP methyl ester carboxylesterase
VLFLFFRQHSIIYYPRAYPPGVPGPSSGVITLTFVTPDGSQAAYYLPPAKAAGDAPRNLWLLFGGNASLALDWLDFVEFVRDSSAAFLFIDYPGYGRNEGKASPDGILRTTEGALASLGRRWGVQFKPARSSADSGGHPQAGAEPARVPVLNVMGHSLGCAAGLQCAARWPVDRIILLAPFTTMRAMARKAVGTWLSGLLRHDFDNLAAMKVLQQRSPQPRVFIFHGTDDLVIPVRMGRELAALAPEMVTYSEVLHADHNELLASCAREIQEIMRR